MDPDPRWRRCAPPLPDRATRRSACIAMNHPRRTEPRRTVTSS